MFAVEAVRQRIEAELLGLVTGPGAPAIDFLAPPGDPGLFGPRSVAWRVHGDLATMIVGGIAALFLQTLHPLAMAGVHDHSQFRRDPLARLRRTATFIAGTTYGATPVAESLIARVRRVHEGVVGTAPDGRRYAAGDPALLTWVHAAEVACFLAAYLRYSGDAVTPADRDRYLDETARVAERLGAREVPRSVGALERYFARVRPELAFGAQARETVAFLLAVRAPRPALDPWRRLFFAAALDLLPGWARALLELSPLRRAARPLVRPAYRATARAVRWALRRSAAAQARARVAAVG